MRGRSFIWGLLLVGCKGGDRAPAPVPVVTHVAVAADAALDATPMKLEIACGPAMLAPRIPPPATKPAPKQQPTIDNVLTGGGLDISGATAQGQGANGLIGQGQGQGQGQGMSNIGGIGVPKNIDVPVLTFGTPEIHGSLDKLVVLRSLRRMRSRFEYCYEQELAKVPSLAGTATLKLTIRDGVLLNASTTGIAADCLQKAVAGVVFPKTGDEDIVIVVETLTFSPSSLPQRRVAQHDEPKPKPKAAPAPPVMDTRSWTPFAASQGLASEDVAIAAGEELAKAMPRGKLETCFAGKTGSERVMVQVAFDGAVIGARSGGSGDAQIDACLATSLIGLKVTAPPTVTELACDITRGDAQPWRVAPESYSVLEVTATEIRENGAALAATALVPQKGDTSRAFLIVADPAAPARLLASAFERTAWSTATLVAVKQDAGAPVFVALGRDGRTRDPDYAPLLAFQPMGDAVKSCAGKVARGEGRKAEAATLLQALAASCDPKPCPASLSIGLVGTVQELATFADAARRAGLPRVELSTTGCP